MTQKSNAPLEVSFETGTQLARELEGQDLKSIFILSDGLNVNGSALVEGMPSVSGDDVVITGGLAGDGADFKETFVGHNKTPETHQVIAVGFYGESFDVGHGSLGGGGRHLVLSVKLRRQRDLCFMSWTENRL